MTIQNDFLTFATGSGAFVTPQSTWVTDTTILGNGFGTGIADNYAANKLWRQSSIWTNVLSTLINDKLNLNTIDDGTTSTLLSNLTLAVMANGFVVDISSITNHLVANFSPALTSLADGIVINIKPAITNTGATTLNVNGLGLVNVETQGGPLAGGELMAGKIYQLIYSGTTTKWYLLGFQTNGITVSLSDNSTNLATTAWVKGQSYAPLASPNFTGTPVSTTPGTGDNSTAIATTAYVKSQAYATLASPALTGTPTTTTPSAGDNSTNIASTAFVANSYAPLLSPALTGTPTSPTVSLNTDSSTKIATTAFVQSALNQFTFSINKVQRSKQSYFVWTNDGVIYSWGLNTAGVLAHGSAAGNDMAATVQFPTYENGHQIIDFCVLGNTCYALSNSGNLFGWGENAYGQLGVGNTTSYNYPVLILTNVTQLFYADNREGFEQGTNYVSMYVKLNNGNFFCTGYNANGELGLGSTSTPNTTEQHSWVAMVPPTGKTIQKIWPSHPINKSTFIQTTDGNVYGTGYNALGQLGNGATTSISYWANLTALNGLTLLGIKVNGYNDTGPANQQSSVAWTSNQLYTAGNNTHGQLGIGTTTNSSTWNLVLNVAGKTIQKVCKPSLSVWVLYSDGTYTRWGFNTNGQLGNGTTTNATTPVNSGGGDFATNIWATTGAGGGVQAGQTWLLKSTGLWFAGYNSSSSSGTPNSANAAISTQFWLNLNNMNIADIATSGVTTTGSAIMTFTNSSQILGCGNNSQVELNNATGSAVGQFRELNVIPFNHARG